MVCIMENLELKIPRLKAWDAEEDTKGWCVDIKDLKNYLEELLNKADNFKSDDSLYILESGIKALIKHLN